MRLRAALAAAICLLYGCGGSKSTATTPTAPATSTSSDTEPLQTAATSSGRLIGTAVQSGYLGDSRYTSVLARHFNYLTAEYEMKWASIGRAPGVNDFGGGDALA